MKNTVFIINKYVAKGNINMQLFFDCNQYLEGEVQNVFFSYENAKELFEEYESFYDPNTVETVVYTLEEYTIENPMSEQELKAELNDSLEQLIDIDFNPVYKCTVMQSQSNSYKIISEEGKYDYENAIYDIADSILEQAQSILLPILLPILAVTIIFYGFKILTASDAKSVEEAKRNAIHCIIGPIKALIVLAIALAIFGLICSIIFYICD